MSFGTDFIVSAVCAAALTAALCMLCARPLLGILQQEGYSGCALLRHLYGKGNMQRKRLSLLALSLTLLTALFALCFSFLPMPYPNLVALAPHVGLYALYIVSERKYALKVPLSPTPRLLRLAVCSAVFCAGVGTGMAFGLAALSVWANVFWLYLLRFVPFALMPLLLPLLLCAANGVMKGYEIPHGKRFVRRAARALSASGCKKVGITGSFGKTSVKHYAAAILGGKFRVQMTPASYNTPLGIARAVNGGLDCDIFLAEMGARRRGDIAELCDLVRPTVGVVTGVCPQHLETFGSLDAIRAEKGVLAARTERAVLGASAADMGGANDLIEGRDFAAEEVELRTDGTSFTLRLEGKSARVEVPLLGRHAAEDVALAAALCRILGMEFEEIVAAVPSLKPVPHRLESLGGGRVHILDDSYNSNPEGARDAIEVLRLFGGKRAVVTPGLVELGELEERANGELGALLAGLDLVVLVGQTRVQCVSNGYLSAGGDAEKLVVVPTLREAQRAISERLSEGDAVLFLNDLPDKYL